MKISFICSVILVVISVIGMGSVSAQDNSAEIANLQHQIDRLQSVMSLGVQEIDRVAGQGAQGMSQQISSWENQLANIDTQIAKLDDAISKASDQQQSGLTQSLNNLLRQKAGAEAYLVQLRMKYENAINHLNREKSKFTGQYNQNIDNLNQQLDNLIQVNCCLDGSCSQKSRADCASAGGAVVSDCAQECSKINCCKDGAVTEISRAQCAATGGTEVKYPSYEGELYKCKTTSGKCVDSTRGECEKNGGVVGTKTDCPQ